MSGSVRKAFSFYLNNQVQPGLVTVGCFDGRSPSLACGTSGGRVVIHSPHEQAVEDGQDRTIRYLNINKTITALGAGRLAPNRDYDILLVGMEASLTAYDVEKNSDLFYRDVPDGVRCLTFGALPRAPQPLAFVGGYCSIQAFDHEGNESFWTVAGDTVRALAFVDYSKPDDRREVLTGSDDFAIRVFREEEMVAEVTEADRVTSLCRVRPGRFAYALANGSLGLYNRTSRVWRVKSKHQCTALLAFDLNADGVPEIVSGWNNGTMSVRNMETGEVIFKDHFASPVAGMVESDYRITGVTDILVTAQGGEVRGYMPTPPDMREAAQDGEDQDQKAIVELQQRKADLLLELKGLEDSLKAVKGQGSGWTPAMIPYNTKLYVSLAHNQNTGCCDVVLSTRNENVLIVNVIILDLEGGVLEGESLVYSPDEPAADCSIPILPKKNAPADLLVQAHVSGRGRSGSSLQLYVFEATLHLPRFCLFMPIDGDPPSEPSAYVTFTLKEQIGRIATWIDESFLTPRRPDTARQQQTLTYNFLGLRRQAINGNSAAAPRNPHLSIQAKKINGCQVQIRVEDMEAAGELVQDLCRYLKLDELESTASFPADMESFRSVLSRVADYNVQRLKMTAEMADVSQRVKVLVVRAEDARVLGDMDAMKRHYAELFKLNNQLVGEYVKRSTNHQALLEALKEINLMIQKAANLRMGSAKARVVTDCRNAIKTNNVQSLLQIVSSGNDLRAGR